MCLYSEVFDIVSPMGQQVERLWLTEASVMYVSASGGDKRREDRERGSARAAGRRGGEGRPAGGWPQLH